MGLPRGMEWIVILVIILLLFGVGRIGKIAKELGGGIRSFKQGLQGEEKKPEDEKSEAKENKDEPAG